MTAIEGTNLSGNLHCKPLSTHLTRAITFGATSVGKLAEENTWQELPVDLVSKGMLIIGATVAIPLSLIETISSLALGIIGLVVDRYLFGSQIEFLQKYSLKCLSYSMNSGITAIGNFFLALGMPKLRYHTANALIDNGIYLGTAAFTQFAVGSIVDEASGRSRNEARLRTLNLLSDSHPSVLQDVVDQIHRDFGIHIFNPMGQIPALNQYIADHLPNLGRIMNFDIDNLENPEYQVEIFGLVRRFLAYFQLIDQDQDVEEGQLRIELTHVTQAERAYQEVLCGVILDSIVEVHSTPDLANYLNGGEDNGQNRIETIDANIVQPLLCYAQYKEIMGVIECPHHFTTNELLRFTPRREKLMRVHDQVARFSDEDRGRLIQKILRGSDYEVNGAVQDAFLKISELAADLERGPLMTKSYIDFGRTEGDDVITNQVLYQDAWKEAIKSALK